MEALIGLIILIPILCFVLNANKMYNSLKKLNNSKTMTKCIWGIVSLLIGPLGLILYFVCIIRAKDTDPNKYKREILEFICHYGELRPYVQGAEDNSIYVGSYVIEYEGKTSYISRFISIYAKNLPQSVASALPMIEKRKVEEDTYYQFPIKRKYSKVAKITIVRAVLSCIEERYPEDTLFYNQSMPRGKAVV